MSRVARIVRADLVSHAEDNPGRARRPIAGTATMAYNQWNFPKANTPRPDMSCVTK
ncbi:MAG TPA: hypothetical protein PK869_08170 [Candidatus Hydrogenedentes bacterium]|nr:hypothetical protein [Candidatus Hydrogenedentota bacterium]